VKALSVSDPQLTKEVRAWVPLFVRAVRACRLYPETNAMRHSHVDAAVRGLEDVMKGEHSFTLGFREGAVYYGDEQIFTEEDDHFGPSYILSGSSIFELTFQKGVEGKELLTLVNILSEQRGYARRVGEDLVTLLWRHHLPHLRYRYVDVLAASVHSGGLEQEGRVRVEDPDTERLRSDLEAISRVIRLDPSSGEDLVATFDDALKTPEGAREALEKSQKRFEQAVLVAERRISKPTKDALGGELKSSTTRENMAKRLSDLLISALLAELDPTKESPGLNLLLRLFDGMVQDRDFGTACQLIDRVHAIGQKNGATEIEKRFSSELSTWFAAEKNIGQALRALDDTDDRRVVDKVMALLRSLGDDALGSLIAKLPTIERPTAREEVVRLVVESTVKRRQELHPLMHIERAEVPLQLLRATHDLDPKERAALIGLGLSHPSSSVRAEAIRGLMSFGRGRPDDIIARAIVDRDPKVRHYAIRAVAARKSEPGAKAILNMVRRDDCLDRDPAELRLLLVAFAFVRQAAALPELDKLLAKSASLTKAYKTATIEAVAFAISVVETREAKEILYKAATSLNPRLRTIGKAALETGGKSELGRLRSGGDPSDPASLAAESDAAILAKPSWPVEAEGDVGLAFLRPGSSMGPPPPRRSSAPPPGSRGSAPARPASSIPKRISELPPMLQVPEKAGIARIPIARTEPPPPPPPLAVKPEDIGLVLLDQDTDRAEAKPIADTKSE
jgi:hypothetical protein